ncbi:MAG: hypothetical protein GY811_04825 [Myxococcales bacterium]|nr:hypothetical protein [Myxococcales bacterium]
MDPSILLRSVALLGALTLGTLASACVDDGPGIEHVCDGAKCDDPRGTPTAHSTAVITCDGKLAESLDAATDSLPLVIKAHLSHNECLVGADNGVIATIEDGLILLGAPLRTQIEIAIVFEEFRYASLCTDLESASAEDGDRLALQVAQCDASRERSLAEVIGALVDFGDEGTGWDIQEDRESFAECYRMYDEELASSASADTDFAAYQELADCATDSLRDEAAAVTDARCEKELCSNILDELLVLTFVEAGFETAIITSDRACQMLIDSGMNERNGSPEQLVECRMAVYSALASQVAAALP